MKRRLTHTTTLWKERRLEGVVKKPFGMHLDWYEREYRQGRDPYRIERDRHDQTILNRRFMGYADGVRDPGESPSWTDTIATHPRGPVALRCPARAR